ASCAGLRSAGRGLAKFEPLSSFDPSKEAMNPFASSSSTRSFRFTSVSIFVLLQLVSFGAADISFCKCMCFTNYTIVPLYRPKDLSKPCLTCTKQFCLDQKLSICQDAKLGNTNLDTGTGDEGDIRTKCFQRDSTKDQVIVVSFIILTTILLISALVKERI
ncbi:hypothetical protein PTTG_26952, partial [Puccinia triticina 1-1 BBBD Race 1]